ncbi:MAG TPA: acyl-CoA dehydrogenase family protein [Iamia sp.]|nr:acyl-CoA dehydrogenase family protein [Iamia sp.]
MTPPPALSDTISTSTSVAAALDDALTVVATEAGSQDRQLSDEVVEALRRTGINRMLLPVELGGMDAPVLDIVTVGERIGAVDGSTAWCAIIGTGSNIFGGYLPVAGARHVFADPDQTSATMLAPAGTLTPGADGVILSGRWPFASNCRHSRWIGLGATVAGADADAPFQVVFVETSALTIEDTWRSSGLQATGSDHVVARDLIIDPDRSCTFGGPPWADGQLWRRPLLTVYLPLLVSAPLGIARGALDAIADQTRVGRTARRGDLRDDPLALADLATADAHLRAARAGLRDAVGAADDQAARGEPVSRPVQARVCLAAQVACDVAVAVTSVAHQLGGGAAAYEGSGLLRALDDVHAARQHLMVAPSHRSELAKALVGLDVRYPPFVV